MFDSSDAAWTYDGDSATTTIRIPNYSARAGMDCQISYTKGISRKQLNGLAGLNRRLVSIAQSVAAASHFRAFYQEERFAVRIAQTGQRISRAPHTMGKELRQQQEDLRRLPESLAHYIAEARAFFQQKNTYQIDQLKQAHQRVKQLLQQFQ